jgi:hypothetical protein
VFLKLGPEDRRTEARLAGGFAFLKEVSMEDDRERLRLAQDEGEDVESHRLEPDEGDREKLKLAQDEDEDEGEGVEAHRL